MAVNLQKRLQTTGKTPAVKMKALKVTYMLQDIIITVSYAIVSHAMASHAMTSHAIANHAIVSHAIVGHTIVTNILAMSRVLNNAGIFYQSVVQGLSCVSRQSLVLALTRTSHNSYHCQR